VAGIGELIFMLNFEKNYIKNKMGKKEKILAKLFTGQADYNFQFQDIIYLLVSMGFKHRQSGSHNIFTKKGVEERINLQADGSKAKGYQVKQVRQILTKYKIES
jgi:predicted RNA binding protein YcfA (HicA-like mRNA interferase family)